MAYVRNPSKGSCRGKSCEEGMVVKLLYKKCSRERVVVETMWIL